MQQRASSVGSMQLRKNWKRIEAIVSSARQLLQMQLRKNWKGRTVITGRVSSRMMQLRKNWKVIWGLPVGSLGSRMQLRKNWKLSTANVPSCVMMDATQKELKVHYAVR